MDDVPLGSSSVRRNDDTVFDVDVLPNIMDGRRLGVELRRIYKELPDPEKLARADVYN